MKAVHMHCLVSATAHYCVGKASGHYISVRHMLLFCFKGLVDGSDQPPHAQKVNYKVNGIVNTKEQTAQITEVPRSHKG